MGDIVIALDAVKAPKTVNNFVFLALHHYYDGVIFHRIINGFMCQGGDPTGTGRGGPGYRFEDELPKPRPVRDRLGGDGQRRPRTRTAASSSSISGPSGVQLPPQYSLFGKIVKGLDVLDAMQRVPTDRSDRPHEDVVINSVTIDRRRLTHVHRRRWRPRPDRLFAVERPGASHRARRAGLRRSAPDRARSTGATCAACSTGSG